MKRIFVEKELICPFDKCIVPYSEDKDGNYIYKEISVRCETGCEYVWIRNIKAVVEKGCKHLDENSKEYKEYEFLHTFIFTDISDKLKNLRSDSVKKENIK